MNIICKVFGHKHCDTISVKVESAMLFSVCICEVYVSRCSRCNKWIIPQAIYQVIADSGKLQKMREFAEFANSTPTRRKMMTAIKELI